MWARKVGRNPLLLAAQNKSTEFNDSETKNLEPTNFDTQLPENAVQTNRKP